MLLGLEGESGTGKSTLAYSAPLPIRGFQFDLGWQRAIYGGKYNALFEGLNIEVVKYEPETEPQRSDADIVIYELPQPLQLDNYKVGGMRKLWDYFIIRLADAYTDPSVRSVVVDTATVLRRVKADAYLEQLQDDSVAKGERPRIQLLQIEYGKPNDATRDVYNMAQGTKKNLIAVHHLTDEYKDHITSKGDVEKIASGRRILEGLAKTETLVDCHMRLEKDRGKITGKWIKCGYHLGYEGTSVENPTWDSLVNQIEMVAGDRMRLEHRKAAVS